MAINDINRLRLFQGDKVGENRVQPPVFGAPTPPPEEDINAQQSYESLFPTDDIQNVRIQNVLASPQQDSINYTPETENLRRYEEYINQYPQQQDRGLFDRIIAGGMTLGNRTRGIPGGYEVGRKYLDAPYERELEEWKNKIVPLGNAATQENQRNINSRNLAELELKERTELRRQSEIERKNLANEKIKQQNSDIQAMKAANPDYEFNFQGPKVIVTRPGSPTPIVTDIDTGNVTEMTKLIAAQRRAETVAAGATERAILQAETSRANTETAGAQTSVDSKTGLPVVINPRAATPEQKPVVGGTPIQRIPGQKGPSQGADLARVRSMSAEALRRIKNDFLVMPKDPTKGTPTLNPKIKLGIGWGNWNPRQYEPESQQRAAATAKKNLKDLLTLSLIGEMKEQSRTGATGFGQLTGRELDVLESAASRLDWSQDEATITAELNEILIKLEKIMLPGEGEEGVATTPKRKETPAETIKRLGGG